MAGKTREQHLRFALDKIGLRLMKSKMRNQDDATYGRYFIVDPERNLRMMGPGTEDGIDLDAVEQWLADRKTNQLPVR